MANKEIKQIPLIASEVQNNRLERVINKLMVFNIVQTIIIIILIILLIGGK